jgi:hypothetical protein
MEPNQTGALRPKMPGQVVTAVVLLWISVASGLLLTFVSWADFAARIEHGQDSGLELVVALLVTVILVATVAVVIGLHRARGPARTAGLVLAVVSMASALFALVTTLSPAMVLNLAISGVLFGMLVSQPAKDWCDR